MKPWVHSWFKPLTDSSCHPGWCAASFARRAHAGLHHARVPSHYIFTADVRAPPSQSELPPGGRRSRAHVRRPCASAGPPAAAVQGQWTRRFARTHTAKALSGRGVMEWRRRADLSALPRPWRIYSAWHFQPRKAAIDPTGGVIRGMDDRDGDPASQ